ncbi:MAG: hypothetical protein ACOYT4_00235 [Nanoarchaeota archaeon]
MKIMNLEQRIRNKIDEINLALNLDSKVDYSDLINPFCYGIGIVIAERSICYLNEYLPKNHKNYTDFNFNEAVEEFRKDLIIYQFLKKGTIIATAKALSVGGNEQNGKIILCQIIKRNGLNFKEIKKNPRKYQCSINAIPEIDDDYIIDNINKDVKRYIEILKPGSFKSLIDNNSKNLSSKIFSLVKETLRNYENKFYMKGYENLSLEDSSELFKKNYLIQQLLNANCDISLAAEHSGISYGSFKEHLSRRKISVSELRKV